MPDPQNPVIVQSDRSILVETAAPRYAEARDALEFILAGASAVAVGTANFTDPAAPLRVIEGIREYLERHGIRCVGDLVGALEA